MDTKLPGSGRRKILSFGGKFKKFLPGEKCSVSHFRNSGPISMSFGYVVALVEIRCAEVVRNPCGTYYGSYGAKFENFETGPEFWAWEKCFSCFDAF